MTLEKGDRSNPLAKLPGVRHLRVFEAVARLESVTKAAEEIRLSQPALTQTIAKLEAEVGKQLLDRRPTGTYLTAFGRNSWPALGGSSSTSKAPSPRSARRTTRPASSRRCSASRAARCAAT
jgi:DNA-binding transcriptional LysR family regulator